MTESYPYTAVIRLPKRKGDTLSNAQELQIVTCEPTEYMVSETLFVDNVPRTIRDADIRTLLQHCMPQDMHINREHGNGHLRFAHPKYADKAYTLYNGFTFTNGAKLQLRINNDPSHEPIPKANIISVKNLPPHIVDTALYDIFRPYGPINLCQLYSEIPGLPTMAYVIYFSQNDADQAQFELNGKSLSGHTLSVTTSIPSFGQSTYTPKTEFSQQQTMHPEREKTESHSVDFTNLYIKNLDSSITSDDLKPLFNKFGKIVSARVMSNPFTGVSKGYGFVSYGKSEEARAARDEMDNVMVRGKPLIVAYHEPKKGRQQQQQQQQQQQSQPQPQPQPQPQLQSQSQPQPQPQPQPQLQAQPQPQPQPQPQSQPQTQQLQQLQQPQQPPQPQQTQQQKHQQPNRSNGYSPPFSNSNGVNLSPQSSIGYSVRGTRPGDIPVFSHEKVSNDVNCISRNRNLSVPEVIEYSDTLALNLKDLSIGQKQSPPIHHPQRKGSAVDLHMNHPNLRYSPQFPPSPNSGGSNGPSYNNNNNNNNNNISAGINAQHTPYHAPPPLTRQSIRRRSSTDSISSVMTETSSNLRRRRLTDAVNKYGDFGGLVPDIVDLLLTLKSKECMLCLFNQDFLKSKIDLAIESIEAFCDEEEEDVYAIQNESSLSGPFIVPMPTHVPSGIVFPPRRVSKAIPIVAPPEAASLKRVSVIPEESDEVEKLLKSLEGKELIESKQLLGDKLFPLVKATGTRHAPKVTIRLLDTLDLHSLAHVMYNRAALEERVSVAFAAL